MRSDFRVVEVVAALFAKVINLQIGQCRPVLALCCLFSRSHRSYREELRAIDTLDAQTRQEIEAATSTLGGETEAAYQGLVEQFDRWKASCVRTQTPPQVVWHEHNDSLGAARAFHIQEPSAKIAITNFANPVRVGGADSSGCRGSQEEQLFRATLLRVSLETSFHQADLANRERTARYIPYYGAIASAQIPTIDDPNERFTFISASAPDLRRSVRSEGRYFAHQDPSLVREVLYRKLSVILMTAAMQECRVVVLGAFGCGAFGNDPQMVAETLHDIIDEGRFAGVISHLILPIGPGRNHDAFSVHLPGNPK